MDHKTAFFLSIMERFSWLGNWFFFLIALIECLPIVGGFFPGGTLVSIGGFFAAQGYFKIWEIILFSTLGAIIGDYSGFSLGRWGSDWLIGKKLIKPEFLEKGQIFFAKHGPKSIFWGRFIGATRAVVPFIAGASKMSQKSFLFWNIISAFCWALFNAGLGYFSGSIIALLWQKWSHRVGLIMIIVFSIIAAIWIAHRHGQSILQYFKKQSEAFKGRLTTSRHFNNLASKEPIVTEFVSSRFAAERIFGTFLIAAILAAAYILAMILDLF